MVMTIHTGGRQCGAGWLWLVLPWAWLSGWGCLMSAAEPSRAPISSIADIRKLSREEAAKALPVKITGVVIWRSGSAHDVWNDCIVYDGKNGVWVGMRAACDRKVWRGGGLQAGDTMPGSKVELDGVTDPGGYSPVVLPSQLRRVGSERIPKPESLSTERLLSGEDDCRPVMMDGLLQEIVKDGGVETAIVVVDGHRCRVPAPHGVHFDPARLEDARVRVIGVFSPDFNSGSEAIGLKILISNEKAIQVRRPPLADPFKASKVPLSSISQFSVDASPFRRRVVEGTIIFAIPGDFFYIQSGQSCLRVASGEKGVKPGQRVEVAGFVDWSGTFASLKSGVVRILGTGPMPEPQFVRVDQIFGPVSLSYGKNAPSYMDYSGHLVRVKGVIKRVDWKAPSVPQSVRVESDGYSFMVNLPVLSALPPGQVKTWNEGAEVELCGICELYFKTGESAFVKPDSFHLWLASQSDMRVLRQPPWWTPSRLIVALGGAGCLVVILLLWSWSLRKQVEHQTRIIGKKNRIEAANAERARIARDLHDEIGANLTHISILSTLAAMPATDMETARRHNTELVGVARQTILAFDETIWSINPKNDTLRSLSHYIFRRAEEILAPANLAYHFDLDESQPDRFLPPQRRHGLLLAVKEALHNIIKHAGASHVDIRCTVERGRFVVGVSDNGRGFDASGIPAPSQGRKGSGLDNMRGRLADLGGECLIESRTGGGTSILFRLPLDAGKTPNPVEVS